MEVTHIIKGMPQEVKEKRILRIKEALNFPLGKKKPTHNVIDIINGVEVFFDKPGKEYFREGDAKNINDMTPGVGEYFDKYQFKHIWKDLLNTAIYLSEDSYKKLFVIIYRLAFLMDCDIKRKHVRFNPSNEMLDEISDIQRELDAKKIDFKVLEFLYFLDILGWNEDVKYQPEMSFENPRKGRINNLLSMISIPLIFKQFVDDVIDNKHDLESIDFTSLIDMAQDFARSRGVNPMSNVELVEHLYPFLDE